MGVGIIGAEANRLAIAGLGLGEAAEPGQDDAHLVVDLEIIGPDLQDLAIGRQGRFELSLPRPEVAQVLGRLGELGPGPQRGLERGGGLVEFHPPAAGSCPG